MSNFLQVLLLALLPALGNFGGGLLAEFVRTSRKTLSLALHVAAGIVFGVIALELAPRAFEGAPAWMAGAAFAAGGLFYVALDALVERLTGRTEGSEGGSKDDTVRAGNPGAGAWMVYVAVAVDLFSDGLLIGAGSSLSFELALVLALGQVTADIPEGFATIANFKDKGVPRARRLLLAASFVVPITLGAALSYFLLRDAAEALQLAALAFVAGMLLVAAAEEIIGEAHGAAGDTKLSAFAVAGGFVLFALVASYFEA
jgi:ZIP family zinc transporter